MLDLLPPPHVRPQAPCKRATARRAVLSESQCAHWGTLPKGEGFGAVLHSPPTPNLTF